MLDSGFKQNPTFFFLTSDTLKALCCFSLCPGLTANYWFGVWQIPNTSGPVWNLTRPFNDILLSNF